MYFLKDIKDENKKALLKRKYWDAYDCFVGIFMHAQTEAEVKGAFDDMCELLDAARYLRGDSVILKQTMEKIGMKETAADDNEETTPDSD